MLRKKKKKKGGGWGTLTVGKKEKKQLDEAYVHMGHSCQLRKNLFLVFFPFWRENILVGLGRKHLNSTIYFLPPYPTKHILKKFFFLFSFQIFLSTLFYLKTNTLLVRCGLKCVLHLKLKRSWSKVRPFGLREKAEARVHLTKSNVGAT